MLCINVSGYCVLDHSDGRELLPLSPRACNSSLDPLGRQLPPGERPKRTGADYRALWKTAIHQQILLLRMEKENQRLEGEFSVATVHRKYDNHPGTKRAFGHMNEKLWRTKCPFLSAARSFGVLLMSSVFAPPQTLVVFIICHGAVLVESGSYWGLLFVQLGYYYCGKFLTAHLNTQVFNT